MKKVLLINEGYSKNLGDQAIKETLEKLLLEKSLQVDFQDLTRSSKEVSNITEEIETSKRKKTLEKFKSIKILVQLNWTLKNIRRIRETSKNNKYDAIFIGGGQLILDCTLFPIAMYLWIKNLKKYNSSAKIIIFGAGCGKEFSKISTLLYKRAFSKVDYVYLRDEFSINIFKKLFNDRVKVKYVPDVVFSISDIKNSKNMNNKLILFSPIEYEAYNKYNKYGLTEDEYINKWKNEIIKYYCQGYNTKILCSTTDDLNISQKIKDIISREINNEVEIIYNIGLNEFIDVIAKAEIILSARMHPLIVGYSFKCNVIPFIVSDKLKSFEDEYINSNYKIDEVKKEIDLKLDEAIALI